MIRRDLEPLLIDLAARMPAVAVTGPRQSGKTTLCRMAFPDREYVSLEPLDNRDYARSDPRGFLRQYGENVILDEVQRVPELFSYLQDAVDQDPEPGRFVLTGSQHFGLSEVLSQSLAGRVALLHLLPLSLEERRRFGTDPEDLWTTVWSGGYPRIFDQELDPARWLSDYVATYVQRDVRQALEVRALDAFTTFLRLAAGRTGQELNLSVLGSDAGISHPTVRSWLSVLDASFITHRVPVWHANFRKRVVKAPKIHFLDSGLCCQLLGIREPDQLVTHPHRGAIFESWVASEILKARIHRGLQPEIYHLRETRGIEVDLIVGAGPRVTAVEVKSGATAPASFADALLSLGERLGQRSPGPTYQARLVYGGDTAQHRTGYDVIPWSQVATLEWD